MNATDSATVLAVILKDNPSLSWRGWWARRRDLNEPTSALDRVRRETLEPDGLAQFRRALAFLEAAPKTKALNRRHGCYEWKHAAERWTRTGKGDRYADYYIGEGSFIAACIALGVTIRRVEFATYAGLSESAWSLGDREALR